MGSFTVAPTLSLSIPGNTYAGAYTSTLTFAFNSRRITTRAGP
jgi:hypothetical protein